MPAVSGTGAKHRLPPGRALRHQLPRVRPPRDITRGLQILELSPGGVDEIEPDEIEPERLSPRLRVVRIHVFRMLPPPEFVQCWTQVGVVCTRRELAVAYVNDVFAANKQPMISFALGV